MRARTALAAALATAFLLAGCSATSGTDAAVEGGAPAVAGDMTVTEEMPAADGMAVEGKTGLTPSVVTDRQIIKTGYVSMQVDDVHDERLRRACPHQEAQRAHLVRGHAEQR